VILESGSEDATVKGGRRRLELQNCTNHLCVRHRCLHLRLNWADLETMVGHPCVDILFDTKANFIFSNFPSFDFQKNSPYPFH